MPLPCQIFWLEGITDLESFCKIRLNVVEKPVATVITSSPGFNYHSPRDLLVKVDKASEFAEDPEFTINAWRIPRKDAMFSQIF